MLLFIPKNTSQHKILNLHLDNRQGQKVVTLILSLSLICCTEYVEYLIHNHCVLKTENIVTHTDDAYLFIRAVIFLDENKLED